MTFLKELYDKIMGTLSAVNALQWDPGCNVLRNPCHDEILSLESRV